MITDCFSLVPTVPAILSPPPCLLQLFSPFHSQCHHPRLDSHVLYSSFFVSCSSVLFYTRLLRTVSFCAIPTMFPNTTVLRNFSLPAELSIQISTLTFKAFNKTATVCLFFFFFCQRLPTLTLGSSQTRLSRSTLWSAQHQASTSLALPLCGLPSSSLCARSAAWALVRTVSGTVLYAAFPVPSPCQSGVCSVSFWSPTVLSLFFFLTIFILFGYSSNLLYLNVISLSRCLVL